VIAVAITGSDLAFGSLAVAALSVAATVVTAVAAMRNQRSMTLLQYRRERLDDTYLLVARMVYERARWLDAIAQDMQPPSDLKEAGAEPEADFEARLLTYASPEVYRLWLEAADTSQEYAALIHRWRSAAERPLLRHYPGVAEMALRWQEARNRLATQMRKELGIAGLPEFKIGIVRRIEADSP
jgi:hypothetical protein